MSGRTPWKIQVLIYLLAFGCFYQQSVLLPVLPRFAGDLDLSVTMIGVVLSARFVLPAFFAAQIGEWTARFGLKRSLFWSGVLTIVTTPLYMIADNIWLLLLAQVVSGSLYMASWIASQTYATRVPDRDWVLGIFATVTAVGMTVGPVIGGLALDFGGYNTAFLSYAAGALLMAVTSWLLGNHAAGQPTEPRPRARGQMAVLLRRPGLQAAFLFSFICLFMIGLRSSFLPLYLEEELFSASTIGIILAAGSLGQAAIRPFTSMVMRASGLAVTMTSAAVLAIVGLSIVPLTSLQWLMMAFAFAHGVGAGLHQSLGLVLLAENTSDAERGYAVGLRATVNQVATAGAPVLAGVLADLVGFAPSFYLIGIVLLLSTVWLWQVLGRATAARRKSTASAAA